MVRKSPSRSRLKFFLNAALLRCPQCGQGRVLSGYLTKADQCNNCDETFEDLNADDGPAWFTMFFVGLLTIPLLIVLGVYEWFSMPVNIAIIVLYITLFSLLLLPPIKGLFINILWLIKNK